MPWPDYVTTQFNLVNPCTTDESEYYGSFNTLLTSLFPPTENFQVAPQFIRTRDPIDFTVIFIAKSSCFLHRCQNLSCI
ncbi:hypothetical protein V8E52_003251 [Russula decolorans]